MCWHEGFKTGKTVRHKSDHPRHKNAIPYKREQKPRIVDYK